MLSPPDVRAVKYRSSVILEFRLLIQSVGICGRRFVIDMPALTASWPQIFSISPCPSSSSPSSLSRRVAVFSMTSSTTHIKPPRFSMTQRLADPVAPLRFRIGTTSPQSRTPRDLLAEWFDLLALLAHL